MNNQEHILKVSKIEAGQETLHPETFDMDELMDELMCYVKNELRRKGKSSVGVEIFKLTDMVKCCVHTDRARLRQIFICLLDNSIKYTDTGYIFFGYHTSVSNNMNFLVQDTGLGICNKDDPNLIIAQGLVQQMGGEMEIEASEIAGTDIDFNIICTAIEFFEN